MLRFKVNLFVLCLLAITGCRHTENISSLSTPAFLPKTNVPVTLPPPIITTPTIPTVALKTAVPTPLHNLASEPEFPFTLIGQTGGRMQVISVQDNYVYVAVGPRIVILDITDPARPVVVDQSGILPGPFQFVLMSDPVIEIVVDYAYVIGFNGLFIFDITDFSSPVLIGTFKEGLFDTGVVNDNLVYLVGKQNGLAGPEGFYIVDISYPYNPSQVSFIPLSGILGNDIFIGDGNAYVTSFASGTDIIDISDPTEPNQVGHYPQYAKDAAVHDHIAYISVEYRDRHENPKDDVFIVDVSNPGNPIKLAIVETSNHVNDIEIVGELLYIVTLDDLSIINIADPTNPKLEGVFDTTTFGNGNLSVAVHNGYAFLTHIRGFLQIVNVTDPANPYQVGYWGAPIAADQVAVHNNYAYVQSRGLLHFVDITNLRNPVPISFLPLHGVKDILLANESVYFPSNPSDSETGKLYLVDISDPLKPTAVEIYEGQGHIGAIGSDDFIYLMDNGLRILNMSDPANPVELFHNVNIQGGLYVHDHFLYVRQSQGVLIFDITNPTNPIEVSFLPVSHIEHIEMVQNLAYMSEWGSGGNRLIHIFDMSEPTNPVEINVISLSSYNTSPFGWGMKVTENTLYKAEAWFTMVDLKDLANPIATMSKYGEFPPLGFTSDQGSPEFTFVNDVDFENSHLFVATSAGLMIFEEDR